MRASGAGGAPFGGGGAPFGGGGGGGGSWAIRAEAFQIFKVRPMARPAA